MILVIEVLYFVRVHFGESGLRNIKGAVGQIHNQ